MFSKLSLDGLTGARKTKTKTKLKTKKKLLLLGLDSR